MTQLTKAHLTIRTVFFLPLLCLGLLTGCESKSTTSTDTNANISTQAANNLADRKVLETVESVPISVTTVQKIHAPEIVASIPLPTPPAKPLAIRLTVPAAAPGFYASGRASYYANKFQNRLTASGELYDAMKATAAHKTLRFGTLLKVTNTQNGKSVVVKVNDRGPFAKHRIIDLSSSAFSQIGNLDDGLLTVAIETLN